MFARDESGTIMIFFALCLVPLVMLLALTLDVGHAYRLRTKMQDALDGAALAAGREAQLHKGDTARIKAAGAAYFKQNAPPGATVTVDVSSNAGTFTLNGSHAAPATFARIFQIQTLPLAAMAKSTIEVTQTIGKNLELALVLDISNSMSAMQHINALRDSASAFVDVAVWQDQSTYTSKILLVPFGSGVNLIDQTAFQYLTGISIGGGPGAYASNQIAHWCVSPRTDSTDTQPTGTQSNPIAPGSQQQYLFTSWTTFADSSGILPRRCNPSTLPPLDKFTSNTVGLKSSISAYTAGGESDGETALKIAFLALNPQTPTFLFGGAQPYDSTRTRKVIVLVSDGSFNVQRSSGYGGPYLPDIRDVCTNLKARGVEIFSAYFPGVGSYEPWIKACATDLAHYYKDNNGAPTDMIAAAMRDISLKLSALKLIQ